MTRAKLTKNYPSSYLEIAEALSKNPKLRLEMNFDSPRDAKNFRLDFYSFKGAAIKEELDKMWPEISAFYVEVRGSSVTVQHKDHTETAEKMRKALMEAQMKPLVKGKMV